MRDASAMTRSIRIAIDLPEALLRSLGHAARGADVTPTDYLVAALAASLDGAARRSQEETVRCIIGTSKDWLDLQRRLRGAGYVLRRAAADRLTLHDWPLNRPLLPLEDLGDSLAGLTLRFGAPFPTDVSPLAPARRPVRRAA